MSFRLNLPLPAQLSAEPAIDDTALQWAALFKDELEVFLNGPNDFVRVVGGPALRQVNFGTASITFPGGANRSTWTTVNHGLSKTPVAVFAISDAGISATTQYMEAQNLGATTFQLSGVNPLVQPPFPSASTAYWLAIT
jgi:hypothetical protein